PIWMQFVREALKGVPEQARSMPDGLVTLRISPQTGTLVSAENPDGLPEIFMANHLPSGNTGALAQGPEGQASAEPIFCHAMRSKRHPSRVENLRRALAQEAARLMAEQGIRDFLVA